MCFLLACARDDWVIVVLDDNAVDAIFLDVSMHALEIMQGLVK
jgi:hypothetical protein